MIEYYAPIRTAHVTAVILSGALFFLRGLLVSAGHSAWALAAPLRFLSYAIDTALLTAAIMLLTILPPATFANGWLAVKVALLPAYIALGWLALRRPRSGGRQPAYLAGAAIAYVCMFAVARAHDPLGPVRWLSGP